MNAKIILAGAMGMMLSSCSGDGTVADYVAGTWGADCTKPVFRVGVGSPEYFEASMYINYPMKRYHTDRAHWNGNYLTLAGKPENVLVATTFTYLYDHNTKTFKFMGITDHDGNYSLSDDAPLKRCD